MTDKQRDKNGRYAPGHSGGPGRPKKDRETRYYEIAKSTVTFADWKSIIKKAVDLAKSGDKSARDFLLSVTVGDPAKLRERIDANDAPAISITTPQDVVTALVAELSEVGRFPNDARRAALVSRLLSDVLKALEVGDLAERLERIEEMLQEKE